jgi:hypothetical protein
MGKWCGALSLFRRRRSLRSTELALQVFPGSAYVGHHRIKSGVARLYAPSVGHDDPQDDIKNYTYPLDKSQQDEGDSNPERIDMQARRQTRTNAAQDAVWPSIPPFTGFLLHG